MVTGVVSRQLRSCVIGPFLGGPMCTDLRVHNAVDQLTDGDVVHRRFAKIGESSKVVFHLEYHSSWAF